MSNEIIEASTDPPAAKPACRCTLKNLTASVESFTDSLAASLGIEGRRKSGFTITDDIEDLLDNYYTFGTCKECAPDPESERCKFIGMGEK